MTKRILISLLSIAFLASCGGGNSSQTEESDITFISPTGAPALAFYDQGNNKNYATNSTPSLVLAELQANYYDVVVAPVFGGLKSIKANSADFALAEVVTGGNFFLVGVNKEAGELPTSSSYIVAFAEQDVTGMVFKKLAQEKWNIGTENVHFVSGAADTLPILKNGKHASNQVDFVLTAEPVFTNAKQSKDEGVTLVETYNIQNEWKTLTKQESLVQAGVFVRKSSLNSKPNKMKQFFVDLRARIKTALTNQDAVKTALHEYNEDVKEQAKRFGFNENLAFNLLKNGNRFGLVSPDTKLDVNAFLVSLGQTAYSNDYFVTIE